MAYADVALLQADPDFRLRTVACYAGEIGTDKHGEDPEIWQRDHDWAVCSAPGFGAAYASALAATPPVERPGNDPAVISDAQLLSAVQAIMAAEGA